MGVCCTLAMAVVLSLFGFYKGKEIYFRNKPNLSRITENGKNIFRNDTIKFDDHEFEFAITIGSFEFDWKTWRTSNKYLTDETEFHWYALFTERGDNYNW